MANDPLIDPSKRAMNALNSTLEQDSTEALDEVVILDERLKQVKEEGVSVETTPVADNVSVSEETVITDSTVAVEEARNESSVLETTEIRGKARLLIITKDESILEEGSIGQRRVTDIRELFLEIHVLVLSQRNGGEENPIVRLFENVWLYSTHSRSWWMRSYDSYHIAQSQLEFSGGFRADIIVAEDPFESGIVGCLLSKKYERPFQLHVYEDFFDRAVIEEQEHPVLYEWVTEYVIHRANSVRTKSEFQKQEIIAQYPKLTEYVEVLPSYYNLDIWKDAPASHSLKERYPQFRFILLHVSSMRTNSHTSEVISGSAGLLRQYPTVGLVIVGNGPLRQMIERQVTSLGLENQILFEPTQIDLMSHMKSANVFIHLSEDGGEDDLLLQASVAKVPIIANGSGLAGKLFTDGESACLCDPVDVGCVKNGINRYLNENQDRVRFANEAYDIVFERIEQDYGAYLLAYAESIERSME